MHDLVPIFTRPIGDSINAVDGRELHRTIEAETRFADWMPRRIEQLGLIEHVDYEVFLSSEKNPSGGRPSTEYVVTLDAAKHIALAEKNEKGREIRSYFIAAEKRLRAPVRALDWRAKREERLAAQAEQSARRLKIGAYERYLVLGGDHVTPAMRQVVGVKMVEIATGEPATLLLPADVHADWKTPTEIAEEIGTTPNAIGRIISALGFKGLDGKGTPGMCEPMSNQGKYAPNKQVTSYRYSPAAVEMIIAEHVRQSRVGQA